MPPQALAAPRRRRRRRYPVPPAPRWRAEPGAPDGLALLGDFEGPAWSGREDVGVALWLAVRAVQLWTLTPTFGRLGLAEEPRTVSAARFMDARESVPELADAWDAFSRLVTAADAVEPRALAEACHAVYDWAERRSLIRTAARFAELAAFLDEDDPAFAEDAGWAARRAGYHDRSEEWHLRAFALAVVQRNRKEAVRALIGLGTLQMDLGWIDEARATYDLAVNRAVRTGKRRLAATAQRYRFMLEAEVGTATEVLEQARRALNLAPVFDPDLPFLVYNLGFSLTRHCHYSAALLLLRPLPPAMERPRDTTVTWASAAWAAAGAGRPTLYQEFERQVLLLAGMTEEAAPAAWWQLAEGAELCRDFERAHEYGYRALNVALGCGDLLVADYSRQLLARLKQPPVLRHEVVPSDSDELRSLVNRMLTRLRRWRAGRRGQPPANQGQAAEFCLAPLVSPR